MKTKVNPKPPPTEDRSIAFKAPRQIHGAIKQIVGKLEMDDFQIDGRVPYERDLINWLIGELYMSGPDNWPKRIESAHAQFVKFCDQN